METTLSTNDIAVTDKAAKQVMQVMEGEGKKGYVLRVSVVGGGCSGMSYKLSFDEKPGEKDKIIKHGDLEVAVDPKSILFLKGMVLDFTDGLNGRGFVFTNPNAKTTCGCGSSFSA